MHLLAAFRIQERCRMLFTPFRGWSSTVCSLAWRIWRSSQARAASEPSKQTDNQGVFPVMNFVHRVRQVSAVLAASAFVALASQSYAQEIAEPHLKAARAAIDAVNATD